MKEPQVLLVVSGAAFALILTFGAAFFLITNETLSRLDVDVTEAVRHYRLETEDAWRLINEISKPQAYHETDNVKSSNESVTRWRRQSIFTGLTQEIIDGFPDQCICKRKNVFTPTCPAGDRGSPGPPGLKGVKGRPGADFVREDGCELPSYGRKGSAGLPGPPGPKGLMGDRGKNGGRDGKPGDKGPTGPPGLPGVIGQKGIQGNPAYDHRGPKGRPGATGRMGPDGYDGHDGPAGRPGRNGQNGAPGLKGEPGRPGNPGWPGRDGETGDPGDDKVYCNEKCDRSSNRMSDSILPNDGRPTYVNRRVMMT